jgi:ubiquinone/menaquinone biosynthesis C-methylase UbiE
MRTLHDSYKNTKGILYRDGFKLAFREKNSAITISESSYLTNILKNGSTILDLACGFGRFSIPLAEYGYTVYGTDITPIFIEKAKEEAEKRNLNIEFRIGDMKKIPYTNCSFDYVIRMWNAFSEISTEQEQITVINEIYRVLKKTGLAIIEMRNHRSSGLVEKTLLTGMRQCPVSIILEEASSG